MHMEQDILGKLFGSACKSACTHDQFNHFKYFVIFYIQTNKHSNIFHIGATLSLDLPVVQNLTDGERLNTIEIMLLKVL